MKRKRIDGIIKKIEVEYTIKTEGGRYDWTYHGRDFSRHPIYTCPINITLYAITGRKDKVCLGEIEDCIEGMESFGYYASEIIPEMRDPEWKIRRYQRYSRCLLGKRIHYYKNPEGNFSRSRLLPHGEKEPADEEESHSFQKRNGRIKGGERRWE